MKLFPLFLVSTLTLVSCSGKDGSSTPHYNTQNLPETTQTGSIEKPQSEEEHTEPSPEFTLEAQLKESARNLMKGAIDEKEFIELFSKYLTTSNDEVFTIEMAKKLRSDLVLIFDNDINTYLSLLNAALLEDYKEITVSSNDIESGKTALSVLYSSLKVKANTAPIKLVEEYFIFDATMVIKNIFPGKKIIPESIIASIYQKKISDSEVPQKALNQYKQLNDILDSDEKIFTIFSNLLGSVLITPQSPTQEMEIIKRASLFALKEKEMNFLKSKSDVTAFYKNISTFSNQEITNFKKEDFANQKNYLKTLDDAFTFQTFYLAQASSLNSLEIRDIAQIQDDFLRSTYLSFLKSLNQNSDKYIQYLSSNCEKVNSKDLDLLIKSFLLSADKNHSCISDIAQKVKAKNYSYLADLITQADNEMGQYKILSNSLIAEYFKKYTRTTLYNLILNIATKHGHDSSSLIYYTSNASKTSLMTSLRLRQNETIKDTQTIINDSFANPNPEIYFEAGVYRGNFSSDKPIYLHPLAVLIPEKKSPLQATLKSLTGGRIDGNYQNADQSEVINASMNATISRGAIPRTENIKKEDNGRETDASDCEILGNSNYCRPQVHKLYLFSRTSYNGIAPGEAYVGERGEHAQAINLKISTRNNLETSIYSLGTIGFKGNTGINSPLCEGNSYKPYKAPANYKISCRERECSSKVAQAEKQLIDWPSVAGKAGKGGTGGNGGVVTITTSILSNFSYPSLTMPGPGGAPGDRASCFSPGQASLDGDPGRAGENGKTQLIAY